MNYIIHSCGARTAFRGKGTARAPLLRFRLPVVLLWAFLLQLSGPAAAQHNFLLYQMRQIPQSHLLNPGRIPALNGFVGFPVLSGVRAGLGSNGFTYDDLRLEEDISLYDYDFAGISDMLRSGRNRVVTDTDLRLLTFGSRLGSNGFFSFDVGERVISGITYPRAAVAMFDDVQQYRLMEQEVIYDLSDLNFQAFHYRTFSVSYAHRLAPDLTAGLRLHLLRGRGSVWSENRGLMFRYPGDGDVFVLNGSMEILASGLSSADDFGADYFFEGGNGGMAVDLGATYRLNDRIELSASALDLGFINWKNDVNYRVIADPHTFPADDIEELFDEFGRIKDELVYEDPPSAVTYRTPVPQRYYLGGRYDVNAKTSAGLLFHAVAYPDVVDFGFALMGETRVGRILGVSAGYSYNRYRAFNLGAGFSADLGPVQIYAVAENILGVFRYKNTRSAMAQVGINLNFHRQDDRQPAAAGPLEEVPDTLAAEPAAPLPAMNPMPPAEEEPPVPVRSPLFGLSGTVRSETTGELLDGGILEVYRVTEAGDRALAHFGDFSGGQFSVPLERGFSYLVKVAGEGYRPQEFFLEAARLNVDFNSFEKEFRLAPEPVAAAPEPALSPAEDQPAAEGADETASPPAAAEPDPSPYGFYTLTASTSFRRQATHESGVLLRFRPGDRVEVLEKTDRWWWKVAYRGQTGYVKAALLE